MKKNKKEILRQQQKKNLDLTDDRMELLSTISELVKQEVNKRISDISDSCKNETGTNQDANPPP